MNPKIVLYPQALLLDLLQAILRVFYLAALQRVAMGVMASGMQPSQQLAVLEPRNSPFSQQLVFVLRPLLARSELLLCLVRGQQPLPPPPPACDALQTVRLSERWCG